VARYCRSVVFVEGRRDGRTYGRARVVSGRVDRRRQRGSHAVVSQHVLQHWSLNGESTNSSRHSHFDVVAETGTVSPITVWHYLIGG